MRKGIRLSASQMLAFGFAAIILIGAALLTLPVASKSGQTIPFFDALFTAVSATCVTGLVVYDTWLQFSVFGQAVILSMIQIGGLGFMTFGVLFSMALGKKIGLRERAYLMESVNSMQLGGIVRLVRRILIGTCIMELFGALLLATRFIPAFGAGTGIWYSIFHAVSAFCNAGFDLMGCFGPYSSLTPFAGDVVVNFTIMMLIIVGGIGFVVWDDLARYKWHVKKYRLHTKLVLSFTAALLILPTVLFLVTEWDRAYAGMGFGESLLAALFQSVTTRTAGFNTTDLTRYSEGGTLLSIFLMAIGGGAGSTAGGLKVSTFAVLLLAAFANARGAEDVNLFGRRLETGVIRRAFCNAAVYLLLALLGAFIIGVAQDNIPLKNILFEVFSALGTVGLSTGSTGALYPVSRVVVMLLMYFGRVGSLTVFMAVADAKNTKQARYPQEKIIIG